MVSETQHSPLPWRIHVIEDDGVIYLRDAKNSDVFLGDTVDIATDAANMELTLKCVNAYPKLIALIKDQMGWDDDEDTIELLTELGEM